MKKKVRYNGATQSYYHCSNPSKLVKGKEYEVVISCDRNGWQTDYVLEGIDGYFNSVWFDEVTPEERVFLAFAQDEPIVGMNCFCYRMEFIDGFPQFFFTMTSTVQEIEPMGNYVYKVTTLNSTYIVKVK